MLTCSGVLYQEWRGMSPIDVIGTIAGFGTIIIGTHFFPTAAFEIKHFFSGTLELKMFGQILETGSRGLIEQ